MLRLWWPLHVWIGESRASEVLSWWFSRNIDDFQQVIVRLHALVPRSVLELLPEVEKPLAFGHFVDVWQWLSEKVPKTHQRDRGPKALLSISELTPVEYGSTNHRVQVTCQGHIAWDSCSQGLYLDNKL